MVFIGYNKNEVKKPRFAIRFLFPHCQVRICNIAVPKD